MRILIFGRVGQLGSALSELLLDKHDLVFLDQPEIDLAKIDTIDHHIVKNQPDLVINAAAYTAVDKAESEPDLAHLINASAPSQMAVSCDERHIPFIHFSTDYVFDGRSNHPYTENADVNPEGVYGKTKLAGEHAVAVACRRHVILRTSWLYSHVANNFLKTMLRLAEDKRPLRVVNDQFGSPTFAWDLGSATVAVVNAIESGREDIYGLYHAANSGVTSWYGFAERIFRIHGDIVDLSGIPTSEYPTPAPRPAYSVLSCDRLREVFDFSMPNWEDALSRCLARL